MDDAGSSVAWGNTTSFLIYLSGSIIQLARKETREETAGEIKRGRADSTICGQ